MARFPFTAAALEQEAEALVVGLLASPSFRNAIERLVMASVNDLKQALDGTKQSVDDLVARVGQTSSNGIDPKDLDPILDELNTLKSTVDAVKSSIETSSSASSSANGTATSVSGTDNPTPAPAPGV